MSPRNNVVIRQGSLLDPGSLGRAALSVVGSRSGVHRGALALSDDLETLVFNPRSPFFPGESVRVSLAGGVRTSSGEELPALEFSFTVAATDPARQPSRWMERLLEEGPGRREPTSAPALTRDGARRAAPAASEPGIERILSQPCDTLPGSYPQIDLILSRDPEPGHVFLTPFTTFGSPDGHLVILDNFGMPVFYRHMPARVFDFTKQPNGLLTYFFPSDGVPRYWAMDSTYTVVDSFATGNGYLTDGHELRLLPNGHALLMAYDPQPVGMDTVVAGGDPSAIVEGLIIQELDAAKNVVFQWRSWDHFQITDAVHVDLTAAMVDYVHGNSLELDSDGNLLLSSRHLSEITKIDRATGEVIWRFGLNATQNDFTFVNDTRGFSYQHDARRLPNGHITLFDNGNYLDPEYSSAVEYELDEQNLTATRVWEYRSQPDIFGGFLGSTQRYESGGAMVCWGGTASDAKVTEIRADGTKTLELDFPAPNTWTYRAFRFPWRGGPLTSDQDTLDFGIVDPGRTQSWSLRIQNHSAESVTIDCITTTDSSFSTNKNVPFTLAAGKGTSVNVQFKPERAGVSAAGLYFRMITDSSVLALPVVLIGESTPVATTQVTSPLEHRLHPSSPNPFSRATSIPFDLPRRERVTLEIYDVRGRKVATLADAERPAGRYQETWRPAGVPSGVYFYRLRAGGFDATRKLVLLH